MANILIYDIETAPAVCYTWRIGTQISIGHNQVIEPGKIICISYKWEGKDKVHNLKWDSNQCDGKLLKRFMKVLDKADAVVGHNMKSFDMKWVAGRAIHHGLPPIPEIPVIDTLTLSRSKFKFLSNKLDYLSEFFGFGNKLETGFGLWRDICRDNNRKRLQYMAEYCNMDVLLTEKYYHKIKPYVKLPISMALLEGGTRDNCPSCASEHVSKWGYYTTRTGRFQRYKCSMCSHVFRDTRMQKSKK